MVLVTKLKQNKSSSLFKSATIRLTGWYLLVLMLLSLAFSLIIYKTTYTEIISRFGRLQTTILQHDSQTTITPISINESEIKQVSQNLIITLVSFNCIIFIIGGFVSFLLAQKNLKPIKQAHESQSRFTSDASHELRTPLAVMKTEIEVALRDKKSTQKYLREVLTSNLEEVDNLSRLATMLLDLSRIDNKNLEFKKFDLVQSTKEAFDSFKQPSARLSFSNNNKILAYGNKVALQDLTKILIDNALKYSPTKSLVSVNLSSKQNQAILEVKNTGPGIPADKIEHIFDRFFRSDDSRTCCENKSYGLGLALAKKIIEVHGGEIIATSNPDVETIFLAKIPLGNHIIHQKRD